MRPNTVKEKWRKGEPAIGSWLAINSSFSAELIGHLGYDWVCVDTQHGAAEFDDAFTMLQAVVRYIAPSSTMGVDSCPRSVSMSAYHASPSCFTFVEVI